MLLPLRYIQFVAQQQAVHENVMPDVLKPTTHAVNVTLKFVEGGTERKGVTQMLFWSGPFWRGRRWRRWCVRSGCITLVPAPFGTKRDIAHGLGRR